MIEWLSNIQALLVTLGAFGLVLVLARVKVPLAIAVLAGAAGIGAAFGLSPGQIAEAALNGVSELRTIGLIILTAVLLLLSQIMRQAGQMDRIVSLAKDILRRPAAAMAALPALIGLIPMPGGALFSAPMVESAAGDEPISGARLSAINYWFRHIWEHWWPLYPGVLLAVALADGYMTAGGGLGTFMMFQFPMGVFMAAAGGLIFRRLHPNLHAVGPRAPRGTLRKLLRETSSIWIIVLVYAGGSAAMWLIRAHFGAESAGTGRAGADAWKYMPLLAGLTLSIIWTVRMNRMGLGAVAKALRRGAIYKLTLLVGSVMIFQYMLTTVDAPGRIARELNAMNVPVVLVVAALPFIAGMVTGLAVGFVGTSFPIVLGLVAAGDGYAIRPYVALAYGCGHLGMMLSPIHVCHMVSNRYFKTSFAPVYRELLMPAAVTAVAVGAYFLALQAVIN